MISKESKIKEHIFLLILGFVVLVFVPGFDFLQQNIVSASTGSTEYEKEAPSLIIAEENKAREDFYSLALTFNASLSEEQAGQIYDAVKNNSDQFGLPRELVLAVVIAESRFNPYCDGSLDEIGLMQIRYRYANAWAGGLGRPAFNGPEELYEIDANIQLGSYILFYYLDKYEGDLTRGLVAYNAGETYVDNCLAAGQPLPQSYVEKISRLSEEIAAKQLF